MKSLEWRWGRDFTHCSPLAAPPRRSRERKAERAAHNGVEAQLAAQLDRDLRHVMATLSAQAQRGGQSAEPAFGE